MHKAGILDHMTGRDSNPPEMDDVTHNGHLMERDVTHGELMGEIAGSNLDHNIDVDTHGGHFMGDDLNGVHSTLATMDKGPNNVDPSVLNFDHKHGQNEPFGDKMEHGMKMDQNNVKDVNNDGLNLNTLHASTKNTRDSLHNGNSNPDMSFNENQQGGDTVGSFHEGPKSEEENGDYVKQASVLLEHADMEPWRKLSYQHWPTLFSYYNMTLEGRFLLDL